jgi:hypothetical protein
MYHESYRERGLDVRRHSFSIYPLQSFRVRLLIDDIDQEGRDSGFAILDANPGHCREKLNGTMRRGNLFIRVWTWHLVYLCERVNSRFKT